MTPAARAALPGRSCAACRMSSSTTSGRSRAMTARPSSPSDASPTTAMCGASDSSAPDALPHQRLVVHEHHANHGQEPAPTFASAASRRGPRIRRRRASRRRRGPPAPRTARASRAARCPSASDACALSVVARVHAHTVGPVGDGDPQVAGASMTHGVRHHFLDTAHDRLGAVVLERAERAAAGPGGRPASPPAGTRRRIASPRRPRSSRAADSPRRARRQGAGGRWRAPGGHARRHGHRRAARRRRAAGSAPSGDDPVVSCRSREIRSRSEARLLSTTSARVALQFGVGAGQLLHGRRARDRPAAPSPARTAGIHRTRPRRPASATGP